MECSRGGVRSSNGTKIPTDASKLDLAVQKKQAEDNKAALMITYIVINMCTREYVYTYA